MANYELGSDEIILVEFDSLVLNLNKKVKEVRFLLTNHNLVWMERAFFGGYKNTLEKFQVRG